MTEYQSIKPQVLALLEKHMPEIRERFGIETTQHGYDTIHIKKTNLFNLD